MTRQGATGGRGAGARRGRRAAGALAALLLVMVAVALAGPRLVPSDRLRARVAEALGEAAGGRATVGQARLTLAGGPGLQLRDVKVEGDAGLAVACDEAAVSLAVAPLLRRALVVDALSVRGRSARLVRQGTPVLVTDFALRGTGLRLALPAVWGEAAAGGSGAPTIGDVPAGPGAAWPRDLTGSFTATAARAEAAPLVLTEVTAAGRFDGRRVEVSRFEAACGGGRVGGTGSLDLGAGPAGRADARVELAGVAAEALLGGWATEVAARLAAPLSGSANVACPLGPAAEVVGGLRADGLLTAGEGHLRADDWLSDATSYLGERPDLVDIRFTSGALGFRLEAGVCTVDSLRLSGPDTAWDVHGTAGLDGALDLAVHVRLPAGYTPVLGSLSFFAEALRDAERRLNLDLKVVGPREAAVVSLDFAALSRRAARPGS